MLGFFLRKHRGFSHSVQLYSSLNIVATTRKAEYVKLLDSDFFHRQIFLSLTIIIGYESANKTNLPKLLSANMPNQTVITQS